MDRGRRARAGFTLIETTISVAVLLVVSGGVFTLMRDSTAVFGASMRSVTARHSCEGALKELLIELEQADSQSLSISKQPTAGDLLALQIPVSVVAGAITWGADTHANGTIAHHASAFVNYLVAPMTGGDHGFELVRRVVDATGNSISADEIVLSNVDGPDSALGKGFTVTRTNRLIEITIRMRMSTDTNFTAPSNDLIKTRQLTVRLRNQ